MKTNHSLTFGTGRGFDRRRLIRPALAGACCFVMATAPWSLLFGADQGTTDAPGFRPKVKAGRDHEFVEALPRSALVVWPCVLRTSEGLQYDASLAGKFAVSLRDANIAAQLDVGSALVKLPEVAANQPQFAMFQAELSALESAGRVDGTDSDFVMLVEFLITPLQRGGEGVGGIHCFVLTADGKNAFSFLLNSHHRTMAEARLHTVDLSASAREELLTKATHVVANAFVRQLETVRKK